MHLSSASSSNGKWKMEIDFELSLSNKIRSILLAWAHDKSLNRSLLNRLELKLDPKFLLTFGGIKEVKYERVLLSGWRSEVAKTSESFMISVFHDGRKLTVAYGLQSSLFVIVHDEEHLLWKLFAKTVFRRMNPLR